MWTHPRMWRGWRGRNVRADGVEGKNACDKGKTRLSRRRVSYVTSGAGREGRGLSANFRDGSLQRAVPVLHAGGLQRLAGARGHADG